MRRALSVVTAVSLLTSVGLTATAVAESPVHLPVLSDELIDPGVLDFEEILFVKRKPYSSDHYYTDINNGTSGDRFLPENGIFIYSVRTRKERPVVTAAQMPGGKGFIGKISLSFDAGKRSGTGLRGNVPLPTGRLPRGDHADRLRKGDARPRPRPG